MCEKSPIQKATSTSSPSAPSRPKRSCVAGVCERGTGSVCAWVRVTLSHEYKHLPSVFLLLFFCQLLLFLNSKLINVYIYIYMYVYLC